MYWSVKVGVFTTEARANYRPSRYASHITHYTNHTSAHNTYMYVHVNYMHITNIVSVYAQY